jgi:MOSC domain-containing protein
VKIDALYVYPIKSCAGIAVDRARVTSRGLEHDRRWMVTDENGKFLTQRTLPEMALVKLAIGARGLVVTRGDAALELPFIIADGARLDVEIWDDRVRGVRHDAGSDWFTRALGRPVQLVCMPDDSERPVERDYARDGDVVSFADGYPLLVVNRASFEDLNTRSDVRTDVRRFRPNLVVVGAAAWAEDDWRVLRIGALTLRTPKPCARCAIPGVDPDTAAITKEPLRTLAKLRTRDHQTYFGSNAIPDGEGTISVGDDVAPITAV